MDLTQAAGDGPIPRSGMVVLCREYSTIVMGRIMLVWLGCSTESSTTPQKYPSDLVANLVSRYFRGHAAEVDVRIRSLGRDAWIIVDVVFRPCKRRYYPLFIMYLTMQCRLLQFGKVTYSSGAVVRGGALLC